MYIPLLSTWPEVSALRLSPELIHGVTLDEEDPLGILTLREDWIRQV